jgi:hypothetical protein
MAVKMKVLKSDFLAPLRHEAGHQAGIYRCTVRQHDWVCHYSGGYTAIGTRPVGVI